MLNSIQRKKCSELWLLGNRLWMVVKSGAIYSECRQLTRDMEG